MRYVIFRRKFSRNWCWNIFTHENSEIWHFFHHLFSQIISICLHNSQNSLIKSNLYFSIAKTLFLCFRRIVSFYCLGTNPSQLTCAFIFSAMNNKYGNSNKRSLSKTVILVCTQSYFTDKRQKFVKTWIIIC